MDLEFTVDDDARRLIERLAVDMNTAMTNTQAADIVSAALLWLDMSLAAGREGKFLRIVKLMPDGGLCVQTPPTFSGSPQMTVEFAKHTVSMEEPNIRLIDVEEKV